MTGAPAVDDAPVDEALVDALPGEVRVALLAGGLSVELQVTRDDGDPRVGDVFLGRALRSGAGTSFVDLGAERPGLLDRPRQAPPPAEGAALMVQVDKAPLDDKGAGLTAAVTLPGRLLVTTPLEPGIAVSRRLAVVTAPAAMVAVVTLAQVSVPSASVSVTN